MQSLFKTVIQTRILFWSVFLCLLSGTLSAQYERKLNSVPDEVQIPMCETYDHAILMGVQNTQAVNMPAYVIKTTLEGKELWRKQLNNLFDLHDIINTRDSGFVVTGTVNIYPLNSSSSDSIFKIAVMRFDKCGKLR